MRFVTRKILNRVNGTRQTQKNVVLLVTDSFERGNRDLENSEDMTAEIRQDDTTIVAIGMSQNVNFTLLQRFIFNATNIIPLPELNVTIFRRLPVIAGGNCIFHLFHTNFPFLYLLKMS